MGKDGGFSPVIALEIETRAKHGPVLVQMYDGTEWLVPKGSAEADIIKEYEEKVARKRGVA